MDIEEVVSHLAAENGLNPETLKAQVKELEALKALQENPTFWDKIKNLLLGESEKRSYSTEQRREMARHGHARPDGSYPIADTADLKNAIQAFGRGGANPADKAHIKKRARALGATNLIPENWKTIEDLLPEANGFKIYKDTIGNYRWMSLSSNAFQDREGELFTTKALEEAVEYADRTGKRGPLLVYHVPSAEIGQCDFQGVFGRFLVESGTFDDTPLGQKALEYYVKSDEDHQVSIGYKYLDGDELDGEYDWLRVLERSVCPHGSAANPWTNFQVIGDKSMNESKAAELEKIFGKELAQGLIGTADQATKELEASVKFKDLEDAQTEEFGEIEDEVITEEVVTEKVNHSHGILTHTHLVTAGKVHVHEKGEAFKAMPPQFKKPSADEEDEKKPKAKKEEEASTEETPIPSEAVTRLAELIRDLNSQVGELQTQVKELKASDDEKISGMVTRYNQVTRPSDSNDNVIDATKIKEIVGEGQERDNNPAKKYLEGLLGTGALNG